MVFPVQPFQGFWCDYGSLRLIIECEIDQRISYGTYDLAVDKLNALEIGFADTLEAAKGKAIADATRHLDEANAPLPPHPIWITLLRQDCCTLSPSVSAT